MGLLIISEIWCIIVLVEVWKHTGRHGTGEVAETSGSGSAGSRNNGPELAFET